LQHGHQEIDRLLTGGAAADVDRGQGRKGGGRDHAVAADDAEIARHRQAAFGQPRHDALRHDIVEGQGRGDARFQQMRHTGPPGLEARPKRRHVDDPQAQPPRRGCHGQGALPVRPGEFGTRHISDAAMTQIRKMRHGTLVARLRVDQQSRQIRSVAVDQHQGTAAGMVPDALLRQAGRDQDEAFHLRGQLGEQQILELRRLVGITHESGIAGVTRLGLGAPHQGREKGIGDIRHDQRDIAGAAGAQGPCGVVRHIAQPLGHGAHAFDRVATQQMRRAESPRNGGARHPCDIRHLLDGRRRLEGLFGRT
jgi:hypothetical protein